MKQPKCRRCLQRRDRTDMYGINIFNALTGDHIVTRYYCHFCATVIGIMNAENEKVRA